MCLSVNIKNVIRNSNAKFFKKNALDFQEQQQQIDKFQKIVTSDRQLTLNEDSIGKRNISMCPPEKVESAICIVFVYQLLGRTSRMYVLSVSIITRTFSGGAFSVLKFSLITLPLWGYKSQSSGFQSMTI